MLSTLVTAFINSTHGWAVADQFKDTFSQEESFEDQNRNALAYIRTSVKSLLESNLLSEDAHDELEYYLGKLEEYLAK